MARDLCESRAAGTHFCIRKRNDIARVVARIYTRVPEKKFPEKITTRTSCIRVTLNSLDSDPEIFQEMVKVIKIWQSGGKDRLE